LAWRHSGPRRGGTWPRQPTAEGGLMEEANGTRGRARALPLTAGALVVLAIVALTAISTAGATRQKAAVKLTLAKAKADVANARKPMKTFTGPTVPPGPVP